MTTVTPEGVAPPPEFNAKVDQLTELLTEIRDIKVDQGRSWKWLKRGGGFIAFDVLVTIIGLVGGIFVYNQSEQIARQQHSNCSLYGFVINSYNAASKARSPSGPEAYDQFYRQIQAAADDNNCHIRHKI